MKILTASCYSRWRARRESATCEDRYSNDDRRPHRSQSRHRNFGDDEKHDPGNDGAIDHADDGLAKRFGITTGGKEGACRDEPDPDESEAAQRP